VYYTKISVEFEFRGHSPLGAHPINVALGYDVGKISVGCLVIFLLLLFLHKAVLLMWNSVFSDFFGN